MEKIKNLITEHELFILTDEIDRKIVGLVVKNEANKQLVLDYLKPSCEVYIFNTPELTHLLFSERGFTRREVYPVLRNKSYAKGLSKLVDDMYTKINATEEVFKPGNGYRYVIGIDIDKIHINEDDSLEFIDMSDNPDKGRHLKRDHKWLAQIINRPFDLVLVVCGKEEIRQSYNKEIQND